jgi:hypothetical protein
VIAARHLKMATGVREGTGFNVFYPRSINPKRNFIFRLAGSAACVATDTLPLIDEEAVVCHGQLFLAME